MVGIRARGEEVRSFILENVSTQPSEITAVTAKHFGITRQAVNAHIKRLINQGSILAEGNTRNKVYRLQSDIKELQTFTLAGLEEDQVWRNYVRENLDGLPDNVIDIWHYGFTEMLNNAVDHSEGKFVTVSIDKTPAWLEVTIVDDGYGIFRRIRRILNLEDERHAILELSKGKLTTDPENHTGEGIFFSSRMFDEYAILSRGIYFSHEYNKPEDWIMERNKPDSGTAVFMKIANNTARTIKSIFDKYSSTEDYGFDKTVVPVSLVRYGNGMLVSRSQAKRLLARVDKFRMAIFDFDGIDRIGQAFADEVFRVFKNQHPDVEIHFIKATTEVEEMIVKALTSN